MRRRERGESGEERGEEGGEERERRGGRREERRRRASKRKKKHKKNKRAAKEKGAHREVDEMGGASQDRLLHARGTTEAEVVQAAVHQPMMGLVDAGSEGVLDVVCGDA